MPVPRMTKDINNGTTSFQRCAVTVMDTTDPDIRFDEHGVCNHVHDFLEKGKIRFIPPEKRESELEKLIDRIRINGKGKDYDCIIGVSGGTDSTYVALLIKQFGLRPLAVHLDNGWNSELAVDNIQKTLSALKIDLHTHVLDWEEFRSLQMSFLKASTPDMEIPTDHAINALLFHCANKFKLKYIVSGSNFNDEGIFPESWAYGHLDWKYITSIHSIFGGKSLQTYPYLGLLSLVNNVVVRRIETVALLNYLNFEKTSVQKTLSERLGWRNYGNKHNESLYTKFVQEYILPKKFNIDVRKAYLSSRILCNQISRETALEELTNPVAPQESLNEQLAYFLKKMEISEGEFIQIMQSPIKTRFDYPSNIKIVNTLRKWLNKARKAGFASS